MPRSRNAYNWLDAEQYFEAYVKKKPAGQCENKKIGNKKIGNKQPKPAKPAKAAMERTMPMY